MFSCIALGAFGGVSMKKSAALVLFTLIGAVGILLFQNCGQMSASKSAGGNEGAQGIDRVYEIPLVNVRPTDKALGEPTRVVLDGNFPDGCPAELSTTVQSNGNIHRVHAIITKTETPDQVCTMALRVFEEKVSLGELAPGEHVVQFDTNDGTKELKITVQ